MYLLCLGCWLTILPFMALYNSYSFVNISLYLLTCSFLGLIAFKRNLINIIISLEILLLAVSLQAIMASAVLDDVIGTIFAIFILSIAAAESAVGLALFIVYFRLRGLIFVDLIDNLKG